MVVPSFCRPHSLFIGFITTWASLFLAGHSIHSWQPHPHPVHIAWTQDANWLSGRLSDWPLSSTPSPTFINAKYALTYFYYNVLICLSATGERSRNATRTNEQQWPMDAGDNDDDGVSWATCLHSLARLLTKDHVTGPPRGFQTVALAAVVVCHLLAI